MVPQWLQCQTVSQEVAGHGASVVTVPDCQSIGGREWCLSGYCARLSVKRWQGMVPQWLQCQTVSQEVAGHGASVVTVPDCQTRGGGAWWLSGYSARLSDKRWRGMMAQWLQCQTVSQEVAGHGGSVVTVPDCQSRGGEAWWLSGYSARLSVKSWRGMVAQWLLCQTVSQEVAGHGGSVVTVPDCQSRGGEAWWLSGYSARLSVKSWQGMVAQWLLCQTVSQEVVGHDGSVVTVPDCQSRGGGEWWLSGYSARLSDKRWRGMMAQWLQCQTVSQEVAGHGGSVVTVPDCQSRGGKA